MKKKSTLSETMAELTERGYTYNFSAKHDCIECADTQLQLHPEEFEIDEVFRFEGMTDPGDSTILYAVSSKDGSVKGQVVNAYGMYSDTMTAEMMDKLKIKQQ